MLQRCLARARSLNLCKPCLFSAAMSVAPPSPGMQSIKSERAPSEPAEDALSVSSISSMSDQCSTPAHKIRRTRSPSVVTYRDDSRQEDSRQEDAIPALPPHLDNEFRHQIRLEDVLARSEASALDTLDCIYATIADGQESGQAPLCTLAAVHKLLYKHAETEALLARNLTIVRDNCPSRCVFSPSAPAPAP